MTLSPEFIAAIKAYYTENGTYPGRDVHLNAVYFPWDEPLIGQKVITKVANQIGIVVGNHNTDFVKPNHECPTCTCPKEFNKVAAGWWKVKMLEGGFKDQIVLECPQGLKPFIESNNDKF